MSVKRQSDWKRVMRVAVVPLVVLTVIVVVRLGFDVEAVEVWLKSTGPDRVGLGAPVLFVMAGVVLMSVLVPKTIVSITAGALFGTLPGTALMLVIAVSAAIVNYSIGRWWLYDSIERRIRGGNDDRRTTLLGIIRSMAADGGFGFHFLVRLAPVPTMLISYSMGACGSRLRPFLMAAAVAVIPQALWVHSGTAASLIDAPSPSGLRWMGVAFSLAGAVAISVLLPRIAMKRLEEMKSHTSAAKCHETVE